MRDRNPIIPMEYGDGPASGLRYNGGPLEKSSGKDKLGDLGGSTASRPMDQQATGKHLLSSFPGNPYMSDVVPIDTRTQHRILCKD